VSSEAEETILRTATAVIGLVALCSSAMPAAGQRTALGMLDQLQAGLWELHLREAGTPVERICLRDGRRLIQLRHPQQQCERVVVSDQPSDVTIQYTCPGRGYGRTHIHRVAGDVVEIEAQGIASGLPFNFVAEGRRTADCGGI
jgi:hypothetical protein